MSTLLSVYDSPLGQSGLGSQRKLFLPSSAKPQDRSWASHSFPLCHHLTLSLTWLLITPLAYVTLFYLILGSVFLQLWNVLNSVADTIWSLPTLLLTFLLCLELWLCSSAPHCPTIEFCLQLRKLRPSPRKLHVEIPVLLLVILLSEDKGEVLLQSSQRYMLTI